MDGGGLKTNYFTQTDVQLKFMCKTLSQLPYRSNILKKYTPHIWRRYTLYLILLNSVQQEHSFHDISYCYFFKIFTLMY